MWALGHQTSAGERIFQDCILTDGCINLVFSSAGAVFARAGPRDLRWSLRQFQWVQSKIRISLNIYWILKPPCVEFIIFFVWLHNLSIYSDCVCFCLQKSKIISSWNWCSLCVVCGGALLNATVCYFDPNTSGTKVITCQSLHRGACTIDKMTTLIRGSILDFHPT